VPKTLDEATNTLGKGFAECYTRDTHLITKYSATKYSSSVFCCALGEALPSAIQDTWSIFSENIKNNDAHQVLYQVSGTNGPGLIGRLGRPIRVTFRDKIEFLLRGQ
jgi:hypothetical protein